MTGRAAPEGRTHWARLAESGTFLGIQFFYWVHRLFGRWLFRVALVPVMAYFLLAKGTARRSSIEYQRQLERWRPGVLPGRPGPWLAFRHLLQFGEAMLDKVVAWSGGVSPTQVDILDQDVYRSIKAQRGGRLLVGSHFGNLEYARAFALQNRDIVINVLVHERHAANFARMLERADPGSRVNLFPVDELDVGTILRLKARINAGEWLVIAADRVPVTEAGRTVNVDFLGRPAPLPVGPYVLAATLECPVSLVFAWRRGRRIALRFEAFSERIVLARRGREAQLVALAQRFADRLSAHCALAPLQWFNFYPFWSPEEAADGPRH